MSLEELIEKLPKNERKTARHIHFANYFWYDYLLKFCVLLIISIVPLFILFDNVSFEPLINPENESIFILSFVTIGIVTMIARAEYIDKTYDKMFKKNRPYNFYNIDDKDGESISIHDYLEAESYKKFVQNNINEIAINIKHLVSDTLHQPLYKHSHIKQLEKLRNQVKEIIKLTTEKDTTYSIKRFDKIEHIFITKSDLLHEFDKKANNELQQLLETLETYDRHLNAPLHT